MARKYSFAQYFERDASRFDRIYDRGRDGLVQGLVNLLFRSTMLQNRLRFVAGFVETGSRCLDIGCGSGRIAVFLAKNNECEVHGIDIAPSMIRLAEKLSKSSFTASRCRFICGDFVESDIAEDFDYAIAIGVIEYWQDPQPLLRKACKSAKQLILSFPKKNRLLNPARALWLRWKKGCPVYFYSDSEVAQLLESTGGRIIDRVTHGRYPFIQESIVLAEPTLPNHKHS